MVSLWSILKISQYVLEKNVCSAVVCIELWTHYSGAVTNSVQVFYIPSHFLLLCSVIGIFTVVVKMPHPPWISYIYYLHVLFVCLISRFYLTGWIFAFLSCLLGITAAKEMLKYSIVLSYHKWDFFSVFKTCLSFSTPWLSITC